MTVEFFTATTTMATTREKIDESKAFPSRPSLAQFASRFAVDARSSKKASADILIKHSVLRRGKAKRGDRGVGSHNQNEVKRSGNENKGLKEFFAGTR